MKRVEGFTLLELLVVIAVVAIVSAFLLPVFSTARPKALRLTCLSNLRQINAAVRMYSDDSHDVPPGGAAPANTTNVSSLYAGYKELVKSYVGAKGESSPRDRLFACPAGMALR